VGLLGFVFKQLDTLFKHYKTENKAVREGIRLLLKDRIDQKHRFFVTQGFIPESEMEDVEEIFERYKIFGGNGIREEKIHKLRDLPKEAIKKNARDRNA
jgi:hypothetical protein